MNTEHIVLNLKVFRSCFSSQNSFDRNSAQKSDFVPDYQPHLRMINPGCKNLVIASDFSKLTSEIFSKKL